MMLGPFSSFLHANGILLSYISLECVLAIYPHVRAGIV